MSLIHFSKVSALTLLTISIVACSSGGNHTKISPITPPLSEQDAAEKAAAEKAAAEKAAAEKAAAEKAAAEKAAAEKAAAEKAAAEKAAAEKAAAEKAAAEKAAAEKAAAEKAAAEKAAAEKAAAEKAAAEKAEADRIAAEKAEKERLQKIEANRLVLLDKAKKAGLNDKQATAYAEANKQATDKVAQTALETLVAEKAAAEKAEADRIAAEKAEKERLQKIEANRLVLLDKAKKAGLNDKQATAYAEANKQATDKVAQTALETLVAEKAAADKAEADRIAAEKAEAERLQKIEANRLVLLDKAKKAGLNDEQATAYAEANKESNEATAQTALDTIVQDNAEKALRAEASAAKGISDNIYPVGAITANTRASSSSTRNAFTQESRIQTVVYNQPYSVVLGNYSGDLSYNNQTGAIFTDERDSNIAIRGLKTTSDAIPTLGNATYIGKAFNGTYNSNFREDDTIIEGRLNYNVNFNDRTGSGSITGLGDTVNLNQGKISSTGIAATAQQGFRNGNYLLDFYGKKAEEVAGKVVFGGKDTIGFGGTRGEISK